MPARSCVHPRAEIVASVKVDRSFELQVRDSSGNLQARPAHWRIYQSTDAWRHEGSLMRERTAKPAVWAAVLMIIFLLAPCLRAQGTEATLSGKVTDSLGAAVANARDRKSTRLNSSHTVNS